MEEIHCLLLDDPGRVRSQIKIVVCQIQRFDFACNLVDSGAKINNIKTSTFGQPELFDPKLTRHFLQYAQNTRRPTCAGVEN